MDVARRLPQAKCEIRGTIMSFTFSGVVTGGRAAATAKAMSLAP